MALLFGWNAYLEGASVDWTLASQGAEFVYLGADSACLDAQAHAKEAGLKVGLYWSLDPKDPEGQAKLFFQRGEQFKKSTLPPAVYCRAEQHTGALKLFVETLEKETKKRTLIGGTPQSLRQAGLIFGRSNPLWISHRPLYGGPTLPVGWSKFAIWQTIIRKVKGVSVDVGFNGGQPGFVKPGIDAGFWARGALGLGIMGYILYDIYREDEKKKER